MIGCVALAYWKGQIIGIRCKKGRGIILPGGKWEPGEKFSDCAKREFKEETGLELHNAQYIFGGVAGDLSLYSYTFIGSVDTLEGRDQSDEEIVLTDWASLKASAFGAYYEILEQIVKEKFPDNIHY